MTPELIGTLSVDVVLIGVLLTVSAWIRSDIRNLRIAVTGLDDRVSGLDKRVESLRCRRARAG